MDAISLYQMNFNMRYLKTICYEKLNGNMDTCTLIRDFIGFNIENERGLNILLAEIHVIFIKKKELSDYNIIRDPVLYKNIFSHFIFLIQPSISYNKIINFKSSNDTTPLHLACKYGDILLVNIIISKGADITIRNRNNEDALIIAALNGNIEIVKIIIRKI